MTRQRYSIHLKSNTKRNIMKNYRSSLITKNNALESNSPQINNPTCYSKVFVVFAKKYSQLPQCNHDFSCALVPIPSLLVDRKN